MLTKDSEIISKRMPDPVGIEQGISWEFFRADTGFTNRDLGLRHPKKWTQGSGRQRRKLGILPHDTSNKASLTMRLIFSRLPDSGGERTELQSHRGIMAYGSPPGSWIQGGARVKKALSA